MTAINIHQTFAFGNAPAAESQPACGGSSLQRESLTGTTWRIALGLAGYRLPDPLEHLVEGFPQRRPAGLHPLHFFGP